MMLGALFLIEAEAGARSRDAVVVRRRKLRAAAARRTSFLLLAVLCYPSQAATLRGQDNAHDPSTIIKDGGTYWVFSTGRGCLSKRSTDLVSWESGPKVFDTLPDWVATAAPQNRGDLWAPDMIRLNNRFYLYYSVSSWGRNTSAIGLATNPTLDRSQPDYRWTDQGVVIRSGPADDFNAIDPCVTRDGDGKLWLAFGSFWSGIKLVELDPATGKRMAEQSPIYSLAANSSIEACCIWPHGGYYFLFVNWGQCCRGVRSTYQIRVGRSAQITGPYVDREGVDLRVGGGSLFMQTTGRYVGPGHAAVFAEGGANWLSYHYYDANSNGMARLGIGPLAWTRDGWPVFSNDWHASYPFETDAQDGLGQYDGTLRGNATVKDDPARGKVLDLVGSEAYVSLPGGAANARTFAAWVNWRGGPAGQPLLHFSSDTNRYLCLTPQADATGRLRFAITSSGPEGEHYLDDAKALPTGVWTHLAVTLDGRAGLLFVNGNPVATNSSMRLLPADLFAVRNYIGRNPSLDSYFNGKVDSLWIDSRVLSPAEVASLASTRQQAE
jgi:arabinan endo-1,5-alpha-L-arabinosidase